MKSAIQANAAGTGETAAPSIELKKMSEDTAAFVRNLDWPVKS